MGRLGDVPWSSLGNGNFSISVLVAHGTAPVGGSPAQSPAWGQYLKCPGQGGGFIGGIAQAVISQVQAAVGPKLAAYVPLLAEIAVGAFSGPALAGFLQGAMPVLTAAAAKMLSQDVLQKVLDPKWFQGSVSLPEGMFTKGYSGLKQSVAGMLAEFDTRDPLAPIAEKMAHAAIQPPGDIQAQADLRDATAAVQRLIAGLCVALNLAWTNKISLLVPGHTPATNGGFCDIWNGWDPDQWFHWALQLGPSAPISYIVQNSGTLPYNPAAATSGGPPINWSGPLPYRFQLAPTAPRDCLADALSRVGAPAALADWLWAAIQKVPVSVRNDWNVPLARVVVQAVKAALAAELTVAEKGLHPVAAPPPLVSPAAPAVSPATSPATPVAVPAAPAHQAAPLVVGALALAKALAVMS